MLPSELFVNQVVEKLRGEIDSADPKIRKECIEEEIKVDLGRDGR